MFPEDVNLHILSFLGTMPRKRCWCRTRHRTRCKNRVRNSKACIFCPLHETKRFNLPLYKPYEDIAYIIEKIGSNKSNNMKIKNPFSAITPPRRHP